MFFFFFQLNINHYTRTRDRREFFIHEKMGEKKPVVGKRALEVILPPNTLKMYGVKKNTCAPVWSWNNLSTRPYRFCGFFFFFYWYRRDNGWQLSEIDDCRRFSRATNSRSDKYVSGIRIRIFSNVFRIVFDCNTNVRMCFYSNTLGQLRTLTRDGRATAGTTVQNWTRITSFSYTIIFARGKVKIVKKKNSRRSTKYVKLYDSSCGQVKTNNFRDRAIFLMFSNNDSVLMANSTLSPLVVLVGFQLFYYITDFEGFEMVVRTIAARYSRSKQ